MIHLFMYISLTAMKFYFIIKSFFSLHFIKTSTPSALCIGYVVLETSFVASYSIDTLNVIYRSCTPILLVSLPQKICSLISLYIVNHRECFKKIITMITFSRNHQLRKRLPPSFKLMRHGFVRRNFIGPDGWNGRESTNQLRQHISQRKLSSISCFIF